MNSFDEFLKGENSHITPTKLSDMTKRDRDTRRRKMAKAYIEKQKSEGYGIFTVRFDPEVTKKIMGITDKANVSKTSVVTSLVKFALANMEK